MRAYPEGEHLDAWMSTQTRNRVQGFVALRCLSQLLIQALKKNLRLLVQWLELKPHQGKPRYHTFYLQFAPISHLSCRLISKKFLHAVIFMLEAHQDLGEPTQLPTMEPICITSAN